MATITKADFAKYVDIPANLPASKLTRFITDAATFNLEPAFNSTKLYRAIVDTDIIADSALDEFFQKYVVPFWVYAAFCQFELRHGIDVTQAGMKEHTDSNSENISDKRREELLASDRAKMNVYKSRLLKELERQSRTFDNEQYPTEESERTHKQEGNGWNMRAIGPNRSLAEEDRRRNHLFDRDYGYGGRIDYNEGDYN